MSMLSGTSCPVRILSSGSWMAPCRVSPENPAKSIDTFGLLERPLYVGPQRDSAGGPLPDEHPAALPGDDQALITQQPDRLLDRHPGDPVAPGEFVA